MRKPFSLSKPIKRATLYATALGLYEMHLNGQKVGNDIFTPGWTDYRKRIYYQTYDVTSLLKPGQNALGAVVGDGWAVGYVGLGGRNRYGVPFPRLLAQLNVTYADGTRQTLATDGTWKASQGPILEGDLLMGETYDARKEQAGWDTASFKESRWVPAKVEGEWQGKIEAYPGVPVQRMLTLKPKKITQPKPGVYVYDLGQNMVGWARLNSSGPAGTAVRLRFAEMLNPDGTIYTTNLRGARNVDTYTLRGGGKEVWEPRFTFHGFRYVEVTGYPGKPPMDAITGVVVHSVTPQAGTFACSSPMVNRLQHNIVWGQRGNFLEVPTDCPQRDERLGWMGDAQVFVRTACNNMDVSAFFTKWAQDVDDAQHANGAFTDVSPDVIGGAGTAAWGDAGVVVPWTIYQVYGDKRIIRDRYDSMTRWIDYMEQNSNGLLRPAAGYGDWLSIGANTPTDVIATAYFAYSTELLAEMARAIGKTADAEKYTALFNRIKDAFNRAYVSEDGHIKGDTQTCYVLALQMNLLPKEKQAQAIQYLVDRIRDKNWHLSTGFVGTSYLNSVLSRFGRTDVAYRLLNNDTFPSWGFSIKQGATTIWERWDGWTPDRGFQDPGMNSFNHYSFGAVGKWLFGTVAGIQSDQPSFKQIVIRPEPGGGLSYARATYDSIRGPVASDWKITGNDLTLKVTIPANTEATVYVPSTGNGAVTEGGKLVNRAEGVKFLRNEPGYAVYKVGSGNYAFRSRIARR
jgi:alpha-L-rhamnosidase